MSQRKRKNASLSSCKTWHRRQHYKRQVFLWSYWRCCLVVIRFGVHGQYFMKLPIIKTSRKSSPVGEPLLYKRQVFLWSDWHCLVVTTFGVHGQYFMKLPIIKTSWKSSPVGEPLLYKRPDGQTRADSRFFFIATKNESLLFCRLLKLGSASRVDSKSNSYWVQTS